MTDKTKPIDLSVATVLAETRCGLTLGFRGDGEMSVAIVEADFHGEEVPVSVPPYGTFLARFRDMRGAPSGYTVELLAAEPLHQILARFDKAEAEARAILDLDPQPMSPEEVASLKEEATKVVTEGFESPPELAWATYVLRLIATVERERLRGACVVDGPLERREDGDGNVFYGRSVFNVERDESGERRVFLMEDNGRTFKFNRIVPPHPERQILTKVPRKTDEEE